MGRKGQENINLELKKLEDLKASEEPISEEFAKEHLPLVEAIAANLIAARKNPPCIEFNDLVSWGFEGLIKAKKNFKENLQTKFKTYAYYRIKGEMLDKIRSEWNYRAPKEAESFKKGIQEQLESFISDNIDEIDNDTRLPDSEQNLIENATFVKFLSSELGTVVSEKKGMRNPEIEVIDDPGIEVWEKIKTLSEEEQEIINLFYVHGMKQVDIARKLHYSKTKVCRIHMSIIEKLKNKLQKEVHQ